MASPKPLPPEALCHRCDPAQFDFNTTEELEHLAEFIGQPRAQEAMRFGVGIRQKGYNIFALGAEGTGKANMVRKAFEAAAAAESVPSDWCYVQNFDQPHQPRALQLPPGQGLAFKLDLDQLIEDLSNALSAAFESEEYRARSEEVQEELSEQQEQALQQLQAQAEKQDLALLRTPSGLAIAPMREGQVISPDEFAKLPEQEQKRLTSNLETLQEQLQKVMHNVPRLQRQLRGKMEELDREMAEFTVASLMEELSKKYADLPQVLEHLEAVKEDVVKNVREVIAEEERGSEDGAPLPAPLARAISASRSRSMLNRYRVNLLVDHSGSESAPVIYEDHPTYLNLVGRIEHTAQMGALVTDFQLIKPGALHRANGGYLILEARDLLQEPYAWQGLKRALKAEQVRLEPPSPVSGLISTVSLDPEPIPLQVKVALLGEPILYYLLAEHDPDFAELFRVASDFDDQMDREGENQLLYTRLIASLAQVNQLRPLDRGAVARVIEHASRIVEDGRKLSIRMNLITDLMREGDYWAGDAGREVITADDVKRALEAQIYRSDRIRERVQEQITREMVLIDSQGEQIGQVNGLSVMQFGEFRFGRPSRITAKVRLGSGEVVDIEREVELGGPLHSKGVLILSGFLGSRYTLENPLSLSASLVFEQSYSGVDGDSASSAELYALLSAIAEVPIKQSLAVTGSVNQHGRVQAIGGVNEKIEGFFDICQARGLTGEQGVLIPESNIQHLMLREDVVQAVGRGEFAVYPVETIDQGIELLTGLPAGDPDENGRYPEESINGRVQQRLADLAEQRAAFASKSEDEDAS